jgi:ankyrin repeat protein
LHQYATRGDLEAVAQLLASPKAPMFDINHQNPVTGRTTLHEAVASGNVELVEYLLKKGIDPFVRDFKGKTAIELTRSDKIKSLLKDGE